MCDDIMELRNLLIEGTYFKLAGWENISDISKKDNMINDVIKFYTTERNTKSIEQLIEGLRLMNFFHYLKNNPEFFVEVFCKSKTHILDVAKFESLFKINFSETGSNKRRQENRIVAFWKDYLLECFENEDESCCTLEEILCFCTGSDRIPLFGFPSCLQLSFLHDDCQFPKGNTCGLILYLPVVHQEYEHFKFKMSFGIKNGMVFGFS